MGPLLLPDPEDFGKHSRDPIDCLRHREGAAVDPDVLIIVRWHQQSRIFREIPIEAVAPLPTCGLGSCDSPGIPNHFRGTEMDQIYANVAAQSGPKLHKIVEVVDEASSDNIFIIRSPKVARNRRHIFPKQGLEGVVPLPRVCLAKVLGIDHRSVLHIRKKGAENRRLSHAFLARNDDQPLSSGHNSSVNRCLCTLLVTYPPCYTHCMDAVLNALSDESRRTILEALRDHPATVSELAGLLPIARPGVSRHLRVLREAGLVDMRNEAQWRVYSLRLEPLLEVDAWLSRYRALWEQRLDALHTEISRGKYEQRSSK